MFLPPADNRITKYERIVSAYIVAVATAVTAVVIVADRFQVNLLADLIQESNDSPGMCNAKLGARFLFWAAFAYEFASIAIALHLKSRTLDVVAYQARMKSVIPDQREQNRVLISLAVFAAITYWGSFHLAYGDSKICNAQHLILAGVSYLYLFGVSVARGLLLLFFCHLYFMSLKTDPDRKSSR